MEKAGNDKAKWAQDAAYTLISTQLDLGSAFDDETQRQKVATPYGFGYMFGFADALIQRTGVTDESATLAQLALTYARIFGKQGPKVLAASLNLQKDKDFTAGRAIGGGEAYKWVADNSAPLGLADYLNARR
jgi:hypothetical protein